MKKAKTLALLGAVLIIAGCSDTQVECVEKGYSGVVILKAAKSPAVFCSNGDLSIEGNYITPHGDKSLSHYVYVEEKPPTKGITNVHQEKK